MKPFIIPIFIPNLGCPFRCIFCDQSKNTAKETGCLTSEEIAGEITKWLDYRSEKERPTEVAFYGGTFTSLPVKEQERMLKAASPFIKSGAVLSIRASTRPDCIREENLLLLREYGVETIELGVQSMDNDVLLKSGRGYSSEAVIEAVAILKKYKFNIGIQLMPGLPGDTFEKSMTTAEEVVKLAPQFVRIYPTVVIKDTRLHDLYMSGQYTPLSLEEGIIRSAGMVRLFRKNNIEVIRVGLQSAPTLEEEGNIVAGPYHPAFGEMVESYLNRLLLELIIEKKGGEDITVTVPSRELSAYVGNRGGNRDTIRERLNISLTIIGDGTLAEGEIIYKNENSQHTFNRQELLNAS